MAANFYVSELLDRYGSILSEKQFRILDGYYNNDLSLSEIAENEGITRQGVSDFVKRTEAQLFELEESLKVCKCIRELKTIADEVKYGRADISVLMDVIDKI